MISFTTCMLVLLDLLYEGHYNISYT